MNILLFSNKNSLFERLPMLLQTGTLTEDGLMMQGVIPTSNSRYVQFTTQRGLVICVQLKIVSVPDSNLHTMKFSSYFTCMCSLKEYWSNGKRTKLFNRESWSITLYSKSGVIIGNVFSMLTVSVTKCWTLVCYNLVLSWWVWPPVTLWQS